MLFDCFEMSSTSERAFGKVVCVLAVAVEPIAGSVSLVPAGGMPTYVDLELGRRRPKY